MNIVQYIKINNIALDFSEICVTMLIYKPSDKHYNKLSGRPIFIFNSMLTTIYRSKSMLESLLVQYIIASSRSHFFSFEVLQ